MKRVLLCGILFCLTSAIHADDWPQWLGPRRDGTSLEKGLVTTFPKDGPAILWQRDVGEGYSGPIIAGDRLILFHRVDNDEIVECLNAKTGKELWKFTYPTTYSDALSKGDGPRSTPIVAGNNIITLGAEGTLTCLTLDAGKKIWSRSLTKEFKTPLGYFGIGTSPVVEQNLVLVNVGGKKAGIVAFELDSGKEAWRATDDPPSYSSPVVTTVSGKRLAVFFTRTGVAIVNAKTGAVVYQQRFRARYDASVNAATPLIIGDQAFFSASYETGALLLKLKADGADELWTDEKIMSNQYNTCIYHDGHIYGFDGRQDSPTPTTLRCFELKSRKIRWQEPRFGNGTMIYADGQLIILTEKGDLVLVQATPNAFRETARFHLLDAAPARAQIALAAGKLYARDQRKLVSVNLQK
ncbi:MAG TPA: PQQ-binding-like beta-propeller repeat protein [Gemmataceae bacterium]|nr:PQQ-binding-like beta-propeller repeat protein [Gemmataceae bacterium]